jgi:hypothetical protein
VLPHAPEAGKHPSSLPASGTTRSSAPGSNAAKFEGLAKDVPGRVQHSDEFLLTLARKGGNARPEYSGILEQCEGELDAIHVALPPSLARVVATGS